MQVVPEMEINSKFPVEEVKSNMEVSMSLGIPDLHELHGKHKGASAVIVGGGPSIDTRWDKVRELQGNGAVIYSIERMASVCIANRVIPDYVVCLDASKDVIESFDSLLDATYLMSVQCREEVLNALKGRSVYLFSGFLHNMSEIAHCWRPYNAITVISTGGSVTTTAMCIALQMGCRRIHLFGFDCHSGDGYYAKGIKGNGDIQAKFVVFCGDKEFITTSTYVGFAQSFIKLCTIADESKLIDELNIYGNSLVSAMLREGGTE